MQCAFPCSPELNDNDLSPNSTPVDHETPVATPAPIQRNDATSEVATAPSQNRPFNAVAKGSTETTLKLMKTVSVDMFTQTQQTRALVLSDVSHCALLKM